MWIPFKDELFPNSANDILGFVHTTYCYQFHGALVCGMGSRYATFKAIHDTMV